MKTSNTLDTFKIFSKALSGERTVINKRLVVCPNCRGNGINEKGIKCWYCEGNRVVLKVETIEYSPIETAEYYDQFELNEDNEID